MKIDLHVHIHRTSRCAKEEPEQMAKQALSCGINGLVIFDHNYQSTKEECQKTEELVKGVKLFRGIELNVCEDDVVIISSHTIPFAPKYKEKVTDLKMLADWINKTDSLAILAHPFRRHDVSFDFGIFKPHATELASRHVVRENRDKIAEMAKRFDMKVVSVSDAHKASQLGGFCINTDYDVNNEQELIEVVKCGKFTLMEKSLVPLCVYARNEHF